MLADHPVEQAVVAAGDLDGAGLVDGGVAGELNALDEVEGDGVFEAADAIVSESVIWVSGGSSVHELEADVGQVESLAGVREIDCCIHSGLCVLWTGQGELAGSEKRQGEFKGWSWQWLRHRRASEALCLLHRGRASA